MKRFLMLLAAIFFLAALPAGNVQADDTLKKIEQSGYLRAGIKDLTPGFGLANITTGEIKGYDVDFARAIAKKLRVELRPEVLQEGERIPKLLEGKIDIIVATLTRTPERATQIAFSDTYFVTGQQFLVRKGTVKELSDLAGKKIGTVASSTSETNLRNALPSARVVLFKDYAPAFLALQHGEIFAVTTDASILVSILGKAADKNLYEIPDISISTEHYSIGVRKDDTALLQFINQTLLEMEQSGEAKRIFDRWFGQNSPVKLKRNFEIKADN
jgi:polar amino acid transport system substrate-binding protein